MATVDTSILDVLGVRSPGILEPREPSPRSAFGPRRDRAIIHTAPAKPRCERHEDHPADDCPECKGYEVRRG